MFKSMCKECGDFIESTNYDMCDSMKRHVTMRHPRLTANFATAYFFTDPSESIYMVGEKRVGEIELSGDEEDDDRFRSRTARILRGLESDLHKGKWYKYFQEKRNELSIMRIKGEQAFPLKDDESVSTSVKKGFYLKSLLVIADQKTAFGSKARTIGQDVERQRGDYGNEDQARAQLGVNTGNGRQAEWDDKNCMNYFSYQMPLTPPGTGTQEAENVKEFMSMNPKIIDTMQMRKISSFRPPGMEKIQMHERTQWHCLLHDYIEYVSGMTAAYKFANRDLLITNLWSIIHQVIKIHEILYLAKIIHGDMHAGNIKVILVNGEGKNTGVVVKAFDFGKSIFKKDDANYSRQDLQYLIETRAIGGALGSHPDDEKFKAKTWGRLKGYAGSAAEGFKRNWWRTDYNPLRINYGQRHWVVGGRKLTFKDYNKKLRILGSPELSLDDYNLIPWWSAEKYSLVSNFGAPSESQKKHYPLHKLLLVLANVEACRSTDAVNIDAEELPDDDDENHFINAAPIIATMADAQEVIDWAGKPLLHYLKLDRDGIFSRFKSKVTLTEEQKDEEKTSIKNAFELFANTIADRMDVLSNESDINRMIRLFREQDLIS